MYLDPWWLIFAALLILTLPLNWLAASLAAAAVHELCHILSILALGGRIYSFRIYIGGACIDARTPTFGREIFGILAGPLGSLSLLILLRIWPEIALCGMVQGIFNLLPVYPLDGGRILRCVWKRNITEKYLANP